MRSGSGSSSEGSEVMKAMESAAGTPLASWLHLSKDCFGLVSVRVMASLLARGAGERGGNRWIIVLRDTPI